MKREEAIELLKSKIKDEKLRKHMLAVGAMMEAVAKELGERKEIWELVGLLHDLDYEETMNDPKEHGKLAAELLKGKVPDEVLRAIEAHNFENTRVIPTMQMEKALVACDNLSGLIIATALVMPNKRLKEVRVESIINSFKDKSFARRCNRELILWCEQIGINKERFFEICLEALKRVAEELGL